MSDDKKQDIFETIFSAKGKHWQQSFENVLENRFYLRFFAIALCAILGKEKMVSLMQASLEGFEQEAATQMMAEITKYGNAVDTQSDLFGLREALGIPDSEELRIKARQSIKKVHEVLQQRFEKFKDTDDVESWLDDK